MTSKGESIQHMSDKVEEGKFVEHENKGGLGENVGNAEKENEGCLGENAEEQEVIDSIEYLGDANELEDILKDIDEIEDTSSTENTYGSYVAQSESVHSDTEVSLEDDFDVTEHSSDDDVDEDDEELTLNDEGGPLDERDSLLDMDGSRSRAWFTVGMTFMDKDEIRRAIDRYAIVNGVNVKIVRSEKKLLLATYQAGCPFRLYASRDRDNIGFRLKSLVDEHMCARVYKNLRASVSWLSEHFKDKIQENPQYTITEMKKDVQREFNVCVSIHKCKRAKRKIIQDMDGSYVDEFSKLEAYCNELKVSNPGSDISVEVSPEALEQGRRIFRRMYVCFNASKIGWKLGCRPFIGLDGTFLKGKAKGIILTAVGLDANDSIYPLALGLTEKETGLNWSWFLEWLKSSLDLDNGANVTFMSDMQKGLLQAVSDVLPQAEHRLCARHIYANWSKQWRGHELKKKFFSCAWSIFTEQFTDNLKAMEKLSKHAAEGVVTYNVNAWARAYFTNRCLSWVVDNNISESFNAWIYDYRFLPVIRMFDGIRIKMMEKWANSEQNISTWKGNFSPKCLALFETNRYLASKCRVFFNGDDGYEVSEGQDRHSVLITRKMCTCRAWDLTGIPCQHAICAMYHAKIDPITQISHYYHKDTYIASYRTKFEPVRGKQFWEIDKYLPMLPPPVCKLPGRPPKKRIRTEEQQRRLNMSTTQSSNNTAVPHIEKLSRKGVLGRCSVCRKEGHNKSICGEAPLSNNPRPGRKRKTTLAQPTPPSLSPQSQAAKPASDNPQTSNLAQRKGCVYKARNQSGFGITIDEVTGRTVYNPGLTSEAVIEEGTAPQYQYGELKTKFPIPNEKQLRMSTASTSSTQKGSRKIIFTSQESSVSQPLPVKPPGLMWKGYPSISTSQLQLQRQRIMTRSKASSNI